MGEQIASRVQSQHQSLRESMKRINAAMQEDVDLDAFQEWRLQLVWLLRDFQNDLIKHFDLEEAGGFMTDLQAHAPRYCNKIAQLQQEHREFIPELNAITERLRAMTRGQASYYPQIRRRIAELFGMLAQHESAERELIRDVYFQDMGTGD